VWVSNLVYWIEQHKKPGFASAAPGASAALRRPEARFLNERDYLGMPLIMP
jgi:hypothetical protein